MSEYYKSLLPVAATRYLAKLRVLGLEETDDPYWSINDSKFINDMSQWPPVEYGHIFCYFVERPGVYTQQELLQWKSLEAYNYFQSGHVRTVELWVLPSKSVCLLRALVNPSQRSPDNHHHAWVGVKMDGQILAAHCTCMAGLGEGCSHVAALLFKVEAAVRNGHTSSTSNLCQWNQVFSTKHQPARIIEIDFSNPKSTRKKDDKPSPQPLNKVRSVPDPSPSDTASFFSGLRSICPTAAVLTTVYPQMLVASQRTPQSKTVSRSLPPTILSLYHPKYQEMSTEQLLQESKCIVNRLSVSKEEIDYLVSSTTHQSESLVWHQQRLGRITASRFKAVCRTRLEAPSKSLLSSIVHGSNCSSAALKWGLKNESNARQEYEMYASRLHSKFSLKTTGLHLSPSFPYLGASPDGIVACECCGEGLLEIKCPYSIQDIDPNTINKKGFYLERSNDKLTLSKSHDYFYQVQGQMAVCNYSYCDFVCWTPLGLFVERINRDTDFFDKIKPKLDAFFIQVVLPYVLKGNQNEKENKDPQTDVYCYCRKGEIPPMVACDNPNCIYVWFHFRCVDLTAEPVGAWFCPDCRLTLKKTM